MFLFFSKKTLGLSISDYSIEAVSLTASMGKPELSAVKRIILETGIIDKGKILDKEKIKDILLNLLKSPNFERNKTDKIVFSLPERQSFISIFEAPLNLKEKERLEFIKSQIKQTLPFSLEDLYVDYKIQGKEIYLVASPKEVIDGYLELFNKCALQPIAIETEFESLSRVLIKNKKETTLIIDIGAEVTNFGIFDEKGLRLSISNEISGAKFTHSLQESLKVSKEEAERIKKEFGLNPEKEEGKIFLILQKDVQIGVIWEVRKIEEYFLKKEGKKIDRIILTGGSASLPFLKDYLTYNLEKKVEIGDVWAKIRGVKIKSEELREGFIFYQVSIGAALRGLERNPKEIGINLATRKVL